MYVDIMTAGEKFLLIYADISPVVYWSIRLSRRRGADGVKGGEVVNRYFSSLLVSL